MGTDMNKEIAALRRMTAGELRGKYADLFGEGSRSGNRDWLFRRCAWRAQALAEGGLSERARQRARDLAREADLRLRPPKGMTMASAVGTSVVTGRIAVQHDARLPMPGVVLTRVFKGHEHRVTVLPDGFEHDGEFYRSLSAVAHAITGSHWNGFHFFGIQKSSPEFQKLKDAFDLWCALWFWPADQIGCAPLPTQFAGGEITETGRQMARQVANQRRFFHWELEFPDVFNAFSHGFDAVLGNPPWDIAKPNSQEFFSDVDPLYRSYGKQEAIAKQTGLFERDAAIEHQWLDHNANFKAMSNWVKYVGFPFGDRVSENSEGRKSHGFNLGDRGRSSFESSARRHRRWKTKREETTGYADAAHSFRHQGSADINLYKLFLEQAHALLTDRGRLGLIVPAGVHGDFGTSDLRQLFLDHCRWEWLFSFINWRKIFPGVYYRFKFAVLVVRKGTETSEVNTCFLRTRVEDWENAERHSIAFPRDRIRRFSPRTLTILELRSQRDLDTLETIYADTVMLTDEGSAGWAPHYSAELHITNDSKAFPPRPKWEDWGYRPDEYSRWINGPWKPLEQLYTELGTQPLSD